VNLRRRRWTRPLVDSVHAAGLLAVGWDAQTTRRIRGLLDLGCDAVYSDHVDRMVAVLRSWSAQTEGRR
jgi:glycerophosphoryl diester phosphodiesterase